MAARSKEGDDCGVICVGYTLLRLRSEGGRKSCLLHAAVKAVTFSVKQCMPKIIRLTKSS